MTKKFKWGGLLALLGLFSLASGTASAAPITFNFVNIGSIDNISSCGLFCSVVQTSGDLYAEGNLVGSFAGTLKVVGLGINEVQDTSTWSFLDNSGLNNLFGTLSGDLLGLLGVGGGGGLDYLIGGGTGLFAGASGGGHSTYGFSGSTYVESGSMTVYASVPEPGMTALMLVGFGMLGFVAYRRRRAQSQI